MLFLKSSILKSTERALGTLSIFRIAVRLRDGHVFMWQSPEILNVFNALTLKQIFSKTKNFS